MPDCELKIIITFDFIGLVCNAMRMYISISNCRMCFYANAMALEKSKYVWDFHLPIIIGKWRSSQFVISSFDTVRLHRYIAEYSDHLSCHQRKYFEEKKKTLQYFWEFSKCVWKNSQFNYIFFSFFLTVQFITILTLNRLKDYEKNMEGEKEETCMQD